MVNRAASALKLIATLVAAPLVLSACRTLCPQPPEPNPLHLFVRLEKPVYQPGEAIVAEALVVNTGTEPVPAAWPDSRSMTFLLRSPHLAEAVKVLPVTSPRETPPPPVTIAPGGLWSRKFVFTRLTETTGTLYLTAAYLQDPGGDLPVSYFCAAVPVEFRVEGAWALRRDRDGIILKDEALRLARGRVSAAPSAEEARLIINEAGFYDWVVRLTLPDGKRRAFLVNPYLGAVRDEIDPAMFPEKKEAPIPRVFKKEPVREVR
ncbi:MAG: hypothetical protein Kow0059_01970 [Candidatus Sumerlaeia bacterium]